MRVLLDRRQALKVIGGVGLVAAGCAHLPPLDGPRPPEPHPCDSRYCRYWQPVPAGEQEGSCRLAIRILGGMP